MTKLESRWGKSGESPLVCICIPTYNAAVTVRETLKSILNQTYPNLVVHISDNASTDDTLKIIESMADQRVAVHRHADNVGGEGNFNRCIQVAEGKYTAIFHADDLYEPDMIAKQVAFLETHPEAGAVFTEASLIDENGKQIGGIRLPRDIASPGGLYDFETMFKAVLRHANFFICPSFMVRTDIYQQEIVCWRGDMFSTSADLDVWLRILERHPVGHLPEALMRYRIGNAQWTARIRKETARSAFFLVVDHYLAQERVRRLLDQDDLRNYARLERRDSVMRAINLYLTGQHKEARGLLVGIFSWDAIKAALLTKRGFEVLAAGIYLRMLFLLGADRIGQASLGFIKQAMRK